MKRVLVLGGGPAGYIAAATAARLGAEVTLVEERELGGTCLNRGCIPTKAMVAGAARLAAVQGAGEFGVRVAGVGLDFAAFLARRDQVVAQLRGGVAHLLRARKVRVVAGRATLVGPGRLAVAAGATLPDGSVAPEALELSGDAVVLASGSLPARLPVFDWDNPRVMTSDELLRLETLPASLAVVGGGVIGCEFASVFARLGVKVTVVELLDQLLPGEDRRAAQALRQAFRKAGIEVMTGTAVEAAEDAGAAGLRLRLAGGGEVVAERVLVSVGRLPHSHGLGYEEAGVRLDERGFVAVDASLRTSLPDVFAAGDVAGPPLLAHWAYHQGTLAASNAVTGERRRSDAQVVPNCIYTVPEVASCGLTEDRAAAEGRQVEVAQVRLNANSKAVIEGEADGFVRLVCEPGGGRVLGATLVGPHATELVHEVALAVQAGVTLADLAATIHAHPTLAESVGEAALAGVGRGLHTL